MTARNLFDVEFYLNTYSDVAASGVDPFTHYSLFGWREDRDPSAFFSTRFYKTVNADIKTADINPLVHYVDFGVQELRDPSPFFDTSIYLSDNPDVANGATNPLEHFIAFGNEELRRANELFDTTFYLSNNADVAFFVNSKQTTAFDHFMLFGHKEGRDPSANFNTDLYLEANIDVAASDYTAFEHYLYAGKAEGRRADETYTIPLGTTTTTTGVSQAENITGNSEANTINGAGGNDVLLGEGGADVISGGSGNDTINGGLGDDTLTANSGNNVLIGGVGADTINAGTGTDTITGGAGDDIINLLTTAGNGRDTVVYSGLTETLNGSDTITTFQTDDLHDFSNLLNSGSISNLTSSAIALASTSTLTTEGTSIAITDETVYIAEVAAKADINTTAKLVTAIADTGSLDALDFAADADSILVLGGADDDVTHYIFGINNDSTPAIIANEVALLSTITTDIAEGIQGLLPSNFSFVASGTHSNDTIRGTTGNDIINGGEGNDTISGLAGNDTISAGAGDDKITGGAGNDTINLLTASDSGSDTVIFSGLSDSLNGSDSIATYQTNDKFDFSNLLSSGSVMNSSAGAITIASVAALSEEAMSIPINDSQVYVAEVTTKANVATAANVLIALSDKGLLDAIDFAANADAVLILGGADDDTLQYIYGIDNNSTEAIISSEITLLGTVTTDITEGIQGLIVDNFLF
ncbi:MAG: hypothetical protein HOJ18_12950 [Rhodospirillaceae bacterium]|nr:hypothetical protein [Rhodospirillaceae bacterium]